MKRITAIMTAVSTVLNMGGLTVFAAEKAAPADIPEYIYEQIASYRYNDLNDDGVIDDDELAKMNALWCDLGDITDLSWLSKMTSLELVSLEGKNDVDLSVLRELPKLEHITLKAMPVTDISFMKGLELGYVELKDMPQITLEQRLEVMRWDDVIVHKGFEANAGAWPLEILNDFEPKFRVDDTSISDISLYYTAYDKKGRLYSDNGCCIYGCNVGTTEYGVYIGDEKVISGKITVDEGIESCLYPAEASGSDISIARVTNSKGANVAVVDGDVYDIDLDIGEADHLMSNVKSFSTASVPYEYNQFWEFGDTALLNDGSVRFNGFVVDSDIPFKEACGEFLLDEKGCLYIIRYNGYGYHAEYLSDGIKALDMSDDYHSVYVISDKDELLIPYNLVEDGKRTFYLYRTGIMSPTERIRDYVLDKSGCLYYITKDTSGVKVTLKAEDVLHLRTISDGKYSYSTDVYVTGDGKVYDLSWKNEIEVEPDTPEPQKLWRSSGVIGDYGGGSGGFSNVLSSYHIDFDNLLTMQFMGKYVAISDVAEIITSNYDKNDPVIYFIRTDNTVWAYHFAQDRLRRLNVMGKATLRGDASGDGRFTVSDLVLLNHYLLGRKIDIVAKNCDLCEDGVIDTYDLLVMRKELAERFDDVSILP